MGVNSNRVDPFVCHGNSSIKIQQAEMNINMNMTTTLPMPMPMQIPLEIHRVRLPPKRTTLQKLRHRLSEIFFPDDPLHRFKNQTWRVKFLLALQGLFPIFQWAPHYNLRLLRSDFISGLTIASLAIPQVRGVEWVVTV